MNERNLLFLAICIRLDMVLLQPRSHVLFFPPVKIEQGVWERGFMTLPNVSILLVSLEEIKIR